MTSAPDVEDMAPRPAAMATRTTPSSSRVRWMTCIAHMDDQRCTARTILRHRRREGSFMTTAQGMVVHMGSITCLRQSMEGRV